MDVLRQPLEEKKVVVSRSYGSYRYPAEFMLVAAMNPCPCGKYPNLNQCTCSETQVRRYLGHISGPILDRMDICVEVPEIDFSNLRRENHGASSADLRTQVMEARERQGRRFAGNGYQFNSEILPGDMKKYCALGLEEEEMITALLSQKGFSVRGYHRILKVARTIADLDGSDTILRRHLAEAVCYRMADEKYWRKGEN